jgi:hypothetical protein
MDALQLLPRGDCGKGCGRDRRIPLTRARRAQSGTRTKPGFFLAGFRVFSRDGARGVWDLQGQCEKVAHTFSGRTMFRKWKT